MDAITQDEAVRKAIGDFFRGALDASLVERLAASADVEQFFTDANLCFLSFSFVHEGQDHGMHSTNLVWDEQRAAWFSFFDGSMAGSDSYFEPDGAGRYRIVWMD